GALAILVLALGGLGWAAVAAIGGGSQHAASTLTSSSSLIYSTETITTNGQTTQTVVAMPKPFRVVFPEGFTVEQMSARVSAVAKIAEHERRVHPLLTSRGYLAAVGRASPPQCVRRARRAMEGFLFPATYEFFAKTTNRELVQEQLTTFCQNWQ